jgi:hypothetical protein
MPTDSITASVVIDPVPLVFGTRKTLDSVELMVMLATFAFCQRLRIVPRRKQSIQVLKGQELLSKPLLALVQMAVEHH